jgi:hypothetical protein
MEFIPDCLLKGSSSFTTWTNSLLVMQEQYLVKLIHTSIHFYNVEIKTAIICFFVRIMELSTIYIINKADKISSILKLKGFVTYPINN